MTDIDPLWTKQVNRFQPSMNYLKGHNLQVLFIFEKKKLPFLVEAHVLVCMCTPVCMRVFEANPSLISSTKACRGWKFHITSEELITLIKCLLNTIYEEQIIWE